MAPNPKEHQLELAAEMLKALADPKRLRLLLRLGKREMSVGEIAELEKDKFATVSAFFSSLVALAALGHFFNSSKRLARPLTLNLNHYLNDRAGRPPHPQRQLLADWGKTYGVANASRRPHQLAVHIGDDVAFA